MAGPVPQETGALPRLGLWPCGFCFQGTTHGHTSDVYAHAQEDSISFALSIPRGPMSNKLGQVGDTRVESSFGTAPRTESWLSLASLLCDSHLAAGSQL